MNSLPPMIFKDIVLLGGGHAAVHVVKVCYFYAYTISIFVAILFINCKYYFLFSFLLSSY